MGAWVQPYPPITQRKSLLRLLFPYILGYKGACSSQIFK
jgi:hypothetical protein